MNQQKQTVKRIEVVFQPQAWIDDHAVDIDGGISVDVTSRVVPLPLDTIRRLVDQDYAIYTLLYAHAVEHDGPCRVEVVEPVCEFFGVKDLSEITEEMLLQARQTQLERLHETLSMEAFIPAQPNGTVAPTVQDEKVPGTVRSSAEVLRWLLDQARELKAMKVEINGDYSPEDLAAWDGRLAEAERVTSHVSDSPDLSQMESNVLLGELRRRGLVVSAWGQDDATSTLENDDETDSLTDAQFGQLDASLFAKASVSLEDLLTTRGNQHIADVWDIHRTSLIAEVCGSQAEPAAPSK